MKERPILFNGEMVKAILDGRKTQTRRMVKPQPDDYVNQLHGGKLCSRAPYGLEDDNGNGFGFGFQDDRGNYWKSPFGTIGDRLWVRETWAPHCEMPRGAIYRCDRGGDYQDTVTENFRWTPSIHMPRWASRITLEITGVRVERLNDISEEDAKAEGCKGHPVYGHDGFPNGFAPKDEFKDLWQSIYGNWDANPWVWVYEFRKI